MLQVTEISNEARHLNPGACTGELIENWGETGAFQIAEVYAFLDENDATFEWLQKAYDTQDFRLAVLLGNPMFSKLTSDARYPSLVEKLGLLPYWQEMK